MINKISLYKITLFLTCLTIFFLPISLSTFTGNTSMNISMSDFVLPFLFLCTIFLIHGGIEFSKKQINIIKKVVLYFVLFCSLIIFSLINILFFSGNQTDFWKNCLIDSFKLFICSIYAITFLIDFIIFYKNKDIKTIIKISSYTLLFFSITCILGFFLNSVGINNSFVHHGFRAKGTMLDTNLAACFILTFISFPLYLVIKEKEKKYYFIILLSIVALLTTCSKAGIIILFIMLLFTLVLFLFKKPYMLKKIFVPSLILIIVFIVLYNTTSLFDAIIERLGELTSDSLDTITTGRNVLWENAFDIMFNLNPFNFIKGIGIGMFTVYTKEFYPLYNETVLVVHNTFLSLWVECGLIMFLLLILTFIKMIYSLLKIFINTKNIIVIPFLLSILALFIYMNSVNMQNNRFVYVYLIFCYLFLNLFISKKNGLKEIQDNIYDYERKNVYEN